MYRYERRVGNTEECFEGDNPDELVGLIVSVEQHDGRTVLKQADSVPNEVDTKDEKEPPDDRDWPRYQPLPNENGLDAVLRYLNDEIHRASNKLEVASLTMLWGFVQQAIGREKALYHRIDELRASAKASDKDALQIAGRFIDRIRVVTENGNVWVVGHVAGTERWLVVYRGPTKQTGRSVNDDFVSHMCANRSPAPAHTLPQKFLVTTSTAEENKGDAKPSTTTDHILRRELDGADYSGLFQHPKVADAVHWFVHLLGNSDRHGKDIRGPLMADWFDVRLRVLVGESLHAVNGYFPKPFIIGGGESTSGDCEVRLSEKVVQMLVGRFGTPDPFYGETLEQRAARMSQHSQG